ncbi:hypothetical protein CPB86DRAFT_790234 [Serendipita vermifera]|nr:hypothetical protein CPB86DRAFT_790234 [Serendipita vermifera]
MKLNELNRDDFNLLTQAFDAIHKHQLGTFLQRLRPEKQEILHSVHKDDVLLKHLREIDFKYPLLKLTCEQDWLKEFALWEKNRHSSAQVHQPGSLQTAVNKMNISLDDGDSDKTPTEVENRVSVPPSEASTETRCSDSGEGIPGLDDEYAQPPGPHHSSQKRKRELAENGDEDGMRPQKVQRGEKGQDPVMKKAPLINGVQDEIGEAAETPTVHTNGGADRRDQNNTDRGVDNLSLPKCLEPWSSIFAVFEARTEGEKEVYQQILQEGKELDELYRVCERKNEIMRSKIRKYLTGS